MNVRYGIVGCGFHSGHHAIDNIPGLELVGLCDTNPAAIEKLCTDKKLSSTINRYTDYGALLASEIDAVVILTPDDAHLDQAMAAIAAGKHVLVDKPLITELGDLQRFRRVVQEAQNRNLVVTTCHPKRFDPPWMWLKQNLKGDATTLGDIVSVDFDFSYRNDGPGRRFYGSFMAHHVSHEIDIMNFILGHSGFTARALVDQRERYEIFGKRNDGITFRMQGYLTLNPSMQVETMRIRRERGTITLQMRSNKATCTVHYHERAPEDNDDIITHILPDKSWDLRTRGVMENFFRAIRGEAPNYLTVKDILMSAEVGPHLAHCGDTPTII